MRLLFALCLLLPFGASASDQQFQAILERQAQIDRFVWDGPTFLPHDSVVQVRAIGRVVREVSTTEKSPHNGKPIKYTTLTFDKGLEIVFRTFDEPIQPQFIRVTISSPAWPVKQNLAVGTSISRVIEALGKPTEESLGWIRYSGETEHVTFERNNGRVSKVVFDYYAD